MWVGCCVDRKKTLLRVILISLLKAVRTKTCSKDGPIRTDAADYALAEDVGTEPIKDLLDEAINSLGGFFTDLLQGRVQGKVPS